VVAGSSWQELKDKIDLIEETYEFLLGYAAQGLSAEQAVRSDGQLRHFLAGADAAVGSLADLFLAVIAEEGLESGTDYTDFVDVLRDDARKASAAIRVTAIQPGISSQLIDNLNASVHVRALLTDVFLLDELIAARSGAETTA
jgi:hypothetical protein